VTATFQIIMANNYFRFKQFTINQDKCVFKVGTDGVLLGACADLEGARHILDVGTGTGLIAIMAAQRSFANIVAIEPDYASYAQAVENVIKCKWKDRIEVKNEDLVKYTTSCQVKFDVIITNPPYFRDSLKNPDPDKSATRHTFSLTSFDLLQNSLKLLTDEGNIQLILPYAEGTLFIAEASTFGLFCTRIIKIKPYPSGEIIRLIMKFEKKRKPAIESFLTIETGTRHAYTEEYKEVTRDFYLKF
jgi:tRNA1Val (adenine37-N6)-methyltransferase